MSMTREEAIEYFKMKVSAREAIGNDIGTDYEAYKIALTALHPVSREQVEKAWGSEWNQDERGRVVCNRCGSIAAIGTENALHNAKKYDRFCFYCGAPMTDEAVDMMLERWKEAVEGV